jgi:hypothetical protein
MSSGRNILPIRQQLTFIGSFMRKSGTICQCAIARTPSVDGAF